MKAFIELRQDPTEGTTLVGISQYSPAASLFGTHEYNGKPAVNTGKCYSKDLRNAKLNWKGDVAVIEITEDAISQNKGKNIDGISSFTVIANGKAAIEMKRAWQEEAIAANAAPVAPVVAEKAPDF
jgi:hypothetical protein